MSELIKGDEYHVWFESLEEMEIEMPAMIARCNQYRWESSVTESRSGASWFYASSAGEAFTKIRDGWPELVATLEPMIEQLRKRFSMGTAAAVNTEVRRRKIRRGASGDSLDMNRVWNGDLDHAWSKPEKFPRLSASQRYATIFADCSASACVRAPDTLWRAAAAYCMIELLTRMGINTEVWSGASGSNNFSERGAPYKFRSGVRIKEFTQPLNENRLATMLCAPFYRTWLFGAYMAGPWRVSGGLAGLYNMGLPKPLVDRKEAGERVFTVGSCLSFDSAVTAIQGAIDELNNVEVAA